MRTTEKRQGKRSRRGRWGCSAGKLWSSYMISYQTHFKSPLRWTKGRIPKCRVFSSLFSDTLWNTILVKLLLSDRVSVRRDHKVCFVSYLFILVCPSKPFSNPNPPNKIQTTTPPPTLLRLKNALLCVVYWNVFLILARLAAPIVRVWGIISLQYNKPTLVWNRGHVPKRRDSDSSIAGQALLFSAPLMVEL